MNKPINQEPCPITLGRPTSKTKAKFNTQCTQAQGDIMNPQCKTCKGENVPQELTILPEKKVDTVLETCPSCGNPKNNLINKDGERMCPACVPMYVNAKLRPQAVIKALKKYNKLTDLFPADNAQANIQKIAYQEAQINTFRSNLDKATGEVDQLKKDVIAEKARAEQGEASISTTDSDYLDRIVGMLHSHIGLGQDEPLEIDDIEVHLDEFTKCSDELVAIKAKQKEPAIQPCRDFCPITKGRSMSTTMVQFYELCSFLRDDENAKCAVCRAVTYPDELTFIGENQVAPFFEGESTTATIKEALKISDAACVESEQKLNELKTEYAKLELTAANTLEETRVIRVELESMREELERRKSMLISNGNVLSSLRERGDIGFFLAESVASDIPLLISKETVRKIQGALS